MPVSSSSITKGPKGHLLFGSALVFRKDPLSFVLKTTADYPVLSRFRFAHLPMVLLSTPDGVKHVLQTNNKNYAKGIEYEHLKPVLGEGLLTSEGDFWLRQRRLAQPAFHKEKISHFTEQMILCVERMMNNWEKNNFSQFDVHSEMMHLALDIVGRTLLSTDVIDDADQVEKALQNVIEESYNRVQALINVPLWLPVPRMLRYKKNREALSRVVMQIIEQRRKSPREFQDLLQMLMDAKDEETGERMSDKQLMDEVMTIFLAGHETTANALTWTFYLLSQNREAEKKFYAEIDSLFSDKKISTDDLKNLPYTTQVIHESLRLYPPAWVVGRTAISDDVIEGYSIKKGDNIIISPWLMHRNPALWENAGEFIPERFSPEKMKDMHKFLYFPFGGGPRFCIGNNFAMMEMQIVLAMVAQKFTFRIHPDFKPEPEPLITLRPKNGMKMIFEKRSGF